MKSIVLSCKKRHLLLRFLRGFETTSGTQVNVKINNTNYWDVRSRSFVDIEQNTGHNITQVRTSKNRKILKINCWAQMSNEKTTWFEGTITAGTETRGNVSFNSQ
jgi:hypothetical protein